MANHVTTESLPGRTVRVGNQELLWFSGTAYLSMGHVPEFQELLREGLTRAGSTWGSSRHNTVRLAVYEEAEAALADFVGAPAALTVSSGMLAGRLVTATIPSRATVFYAPGVHPALWGSGYQPATEPMEVWWERLPERVAACEAEEIVIATDSVGSPHTSRVPLERLADLPTEKSVTVVVDDSHGLGVFGERGEGVYQMLARVINPRHNTVVVSSLNKALGVPAGVIFSDEKTIAALRHSPWFGGSSPAVPGALWAMTRAFGLYREQHAKLLENTRFFVKDLGDLVNRFCWVPDYPAFTTTAEGFQEFLAKNNILTASFPYPTPADAPITRLVVSALHTQEDILELVKWCKIFFGIRRYISVFDRRTERLIREIPLHEMLSLSELKAIVIDNHDDPLLIESYPIDQKVAAKFVEKTGEAFDFDKFIYYLDCFDESAK